MANVFQSLFCSIAKFIDQCLPSYPITAHVHWVAGGLSPNNLPIFTATMPLVITAIVGRVEVPSGHACSLTVVRVADGLSMATGLPLAVPFNPAGLAAANQSLQLSSETSLLTLEAGDSIGIQTEGSFTLASGGITVYMTNAL